jgi:hypothetical protein
VAYPRLIEPNMYHRRISVIIKSGCCFLFVSGHSFHNFWSPWIENSYFRSRLDGWRQRWQFKMAPNLNLYSRDIFKTQFVSLRYSFSDSELNRLNMGYRNNRWFNEGTSSLLSSLALTLNICGYLLFFFKNPNSKTRATLKLSVMCLNIFFNFRLRD